MSRINSKQSMTRPRYDHLMGYFKKKDTPFNKFVNGLFVDWTHYEILLHIDVPSHENDSYESRPK